MNTANDFLKDITGIVTLLIGVALIALLVGHAGNTGYLISQSGSSLNTLLNTVELTSSVANVPVQSQTGVTSGSTGSNSVYSL